jgi:hypothetical protein
MGKAVGIDLGTTYSAPRDPEPEGTIYSAKLWSAVGTSRWGRSEINAASFVVPGPDGAASRRLRT